MASINGMTRYEEISEAIVEVLALVIVGVGALFASGLGLAMALQSTIY